MIWWIGGEKQTEWIVITIIQNFYNICSAEVDSEINKEGEIKTKECFSGHGIGEAVESK